MALYLLVLMFVASGGLFTYLGFRQWTSMRRKLATWTRVDGTVVEIVSRPGSSGRTMYSPVYRYAMNGVEHTARPDTGGSVAEYEVGDTIKLVVNPEQPAETDVIDGNAAIFSYGLLAAGVAAIAGGLLIGWLRVTRGAS